MRVRTTAIVIATVSSVSGRTAPATEIPQGPDRAPASAVILKGRAPVSEAVLRVHLPRPEERDLANGLHLMILEDRRAPLVSFSLVVRGAGGYADPPALPGLAGITAALMREGTATRNSVEIAKFLEVRSATLDVNAAAGAPDAAITGSALAEDLDEVLDLVADVVRRPAFSAAELSTYMYRAQAALVRDRSAPSFLASERFAKAVYGAHPGGRVAATPAVLATVTPAALRSFHAERYAPNYAVLSLVGDISASTVAKLAAEKFGAWRTANAPVPALVEPEPPRVTRIHFVDRRSSAQTNFIVGLPAPPRGSPEFLAMQVMNQIIGGGPLGRLFIRLREELGYTYGAFSTLTAGRRWAHWSASTEVRPDVTEATLRELLEQIARLRDEPVTDAELTQHKRAMIANFALSLESPSQTLGYHVTRWLDDLPRDYWDTYADRVMAVTPSDVQRAAQRYLQPSRLQIVAVGDAARLAGALRKFGPVDLYDVAGHLLTP